MVTPLKPLKWYKKLSSRRSRLESGAFVIEGDRAIRQIMQTSPESILEIVATETPPIIYRDYPVRILPESQFRSICHSKTPQGIMAVVRLPYDTYSDSLPEITGNKILLLEDVQDPGNTSTLIRTAAAFGFTGVIMTEGCAEPFSPKVVQSSAGSLLSLWLRRTADYPGLVNKLKESGFILAAADVNGADDASMLGGCDKLVLALGNEAAGLSGEILSLADYRVVIPTDRDKAESLNVAVCGAILMFLAA